MFKRLNNFFRRNTNPSPLEDEALDTGRSLAYCDPLILGHNENFNNKVDRRKSMYGDPLIGALTLGWASMATSKTFKFYDNHSPNGQEIMPEWRQWWIANDLDELLKACIPHFCIDGRIILHPFITEQGLFDYEVFGSYECAPIYWERDPDNNILLYKINFIPMPEMTPHSGSIKAVKKLLKPQQVLHITRGDWNYGIGRSRVLPCWDPAIKMRHGSHADFFRRDVRFMVAVPEKWKQKRIKSFMDSFNTMLRGNRRAFVYKMEQSKDPSATPLGLPSFGFEPLAKTPAPKPTAQSESGGQLLRDPEWARYLAGCKLTENYFIGNQAGAVTGSETDLTRDFYTECEEFALLEPLIKAIINWFVMAGLIPEPPQDYVVKYWKDWEHIEMGQMMMQQEMQMQQSKLQLQDTPNRENKSLENNMAPLIEYKYNSDLSMELLYCIKMNKSMPMTPVMSSWIKGVGYQEGTLFFETHDQTASTGKYAYDITPEEAEMYYSEWVEAGSKGEYWWDEIRDKLSPARKVGRISLPKMFGEGEYQSRAKEMREFKMEGDVSSGTVGVGTTAEPFPIPASKPAMPIAYNPTSSEPIMETIQQFKVKTPYNITNSVMSIPEIMSTGKKLNWNMSKSTAYNIQDLLKYNAENHHFRTNSFIIGNPMDFDTILRYADNPTGELACKRAWKEIVAHDGDLVVYDDLGHGGRAHKVGNYKYFWSEEEDKPILIYDKEEVFENVNKILVRLGQEDSMIGMKIANGMIPDISTEYYAGMEIHDGVKYQVNFHDSNFEPKFERIAIVNRGNCSEPNCTFKQVEELD